MHFTLSLLAAVAVPALAAPVADTTSKTATVKLTHVNTVKNIKNLVERGQSRIRSYNKENSKFEEDASSGSATNEDVTYVAPVSIGGTTYSLIVDTGCMY